MQLALAQRPDATGIAGYKAWQSLGRHVDKGEKGLQILAPILRRREEPEMDTEPAEDAVRVAGYRVTHVWDIKQTSGDPLPEWPTPILLRGEAPEGLWKSLAAIAENRGFHLQRGDCGGDCGLTHFGDRTITVRTDVDDAQAVKTLAHRLGQVLLHGPAEDQPVIPCRGVVEVEAESIAYLLSTTQGLDTGSYTFPYVVGWACSLVNRTAEEVVRDVGQRVLQTAKVLLDQLAPTSDDPDAHEIRVSVDTSVSRPTLVPATALR
jgi:DNA primase